VTGVQTCALPISAVLIELGFMTNIDDALILTNDALLYKMSEAVYKGIVDFVLEFERSGGFISAP
jgi:N-acetylmuramoyl-L-alanine amidase